MTTTEKAISRGKWNLNWSDDEKGRHLLESSAFTWGIERRHGKWQVVPVPGGMSYGEAVIAADERNAIDRLFPVRRRVREEVEGEEELVKVMLRQVFLYDGTKKSDSPNPHRRQL